MTVELIEFLVGLYFLGKSLAITKTDGSPVWTKTLDIFKLLLAVVLLVLAYLHGVRV